VQDEVNAEGALAHALDGGLDVGLLAVEGLREHAHEIAEGDDRRGGIVVPHLPLIGLAAEVAQGEVGVVGHGLMSFTGN